MRISALPQARTCEMLPGAASISAMNMVWIESMMIKPGASSSTTASTWSSDVSANTRRSSFISPQIRSARILICSSDSSPETYSTLPIRAAKFAAACMISVDLPMPGSPEISVSEPGTSPPPSTLLNSAIPVSIRSLCGAASTDFSGMALARFPPAAPLAAPPRRRLSSTASSVTFCSNIEFQAPQMHCPIHLGLSNPHSLQTYTTFAFFAILSPGQPCCRSLCALLICARSVASKKNLCSFLFYRCMRALSNKKTPSA